MAADTGMRMADGRRRLEENSGRTLKCPWVKAFSGLRREGR